MISEPITIDTATHVKHDENAKVEIDECMTDEEALIALADSIIAAPTLSPNCDVHDLDLRQWTVDSMTAIESNFTTPFLKSDSDATFAKCADDHHYAEMRPVEKATPDVDTTHAKTVGNKTSTLPEHVNVLFLQTTANKDLNSDAENGLKQLLWDHRDTFAKSKMDIGFCDLVKHDIDTGDT